MADFMIKVIGTGPPGPAGPKGEKGDPGGAAYTVTPEDFGAVGDGVHDDGPALAQALESGREVILTQDLTVGSPIWIADKNVRFDGRGHTVTFLGENNLSIVSTSSAAPPEEPEYCSKVTCEGPGKYNETFANDVVRPSESTTNNYVNGYLTYKGRKTLNVVYPESSVVYWPIRSVIFRNVTLKFRAVRTPGVQIFRMCDSIIENVRVLGDSPRGGPIGIWVKEGQNIQLRFCSVDNMTTTADIRRYGIQASGDNIVIDHLYGSQCGSVVCLSDMSFISTRMTVTNAALYGRSVRETEPTVGGWDYNISSALDSHPNVDGLNIDNVQIYREGDTGGNMVMALRCRTVNLSNVYIRGESKIALIEAVQDVRMVNVNAPNCSIRFAVNAWPLKHFRTLQMSNCALSFIDGVDSCPVTVMADNCVFYTGVRRIRFLIARGCKFMHHLDVEEYLSPTVSVSEEAILDSCVISSGAYTYGVSKSYHILHGPENAIHAHNCKFITKPVYKLCNTPQEDIVNCFYEEVLGFHLDTCSFMALTEEGEIVESSYLNESTEQLNTFPERNNCILDSDFILM